MNEKRKQCLEELRNASPLEATQLLQELELYDAKSSQKIIDEIYEQFASGENMKEEVLKPVFTSVVDGLLEAFPQGRAARKKGLTASRVIQECEQFSYDGEQDHGTNVDGYTEYKNAEEFKSEFASTTRPNFDRKKYVSQYAMDKYKSDRVKENKGRKNLEDEYTGQKNITAYRKDPDLRRNDPKNDFQAEPDHIIPLKKIHEQYKGNYGLSNEDIKRIANKESNLAITSGALNGRKLDKSNAEFIREQEKIRKDLEKIQKSKNKIDNKLQKDNLSGKNDLQDQRALLDKEQKSLEDKYLEIDKETKNRMHKLEREATQAVEQDINQAIIANLTGKGMADRQTRKEAYDLEEKQLGRKLTKEEKCAIDDKLAKDKQKDIVGRGIENAAEQAANYAVGNLILFIVKPIYYELSDTFKNGLQEGVNANSGGEALKIRFTRIKTHVLIHGKEFLGDNVWEFVKGFVSSLIEGIISLFVGIFKQILKLIKEGIKIFVQSAKVLFGKDSAEMSPAEKGDAIIKIIGGGILAIAGVGLEALINKIGIGEPWSIVLSTMLAGIASALFMYVLDKADLFNVKAEKRRDRIIEIFDERIKDINEAAEEMNVIAIETFKAQREQFEDINEQINEGIETDNIISINEGLYKLAEFMKVDLPYSNTEEFCDYMDSEDAISL